MGIKNTIYRPTLKLDTKKKTEVKGEGTKVMTKSEIKTVVDDKNKNNNSLKDVDTKFQKFLTFKI